MNDIEKKINQKIGLKTGLVIIDESRLFCLGFTYFILYHDI